MSEQILQLPRPRLRRRGLVWELLSTIVFIVSVYSLAEMAIPRSSLSGPSMLPNLHEGEYLLISRINYLFGEPQRGDVVVFDPPGNPAGAPRLIKRLLGLPGETVEFRETKFYVNGQLINEPYINGECSSGRCPDRVWQLGEDEYFFMGDNRNNSNDSRSFGPIHRERIVGQAIFRYWPITQFGTVRTFRYN